jgi:hypothetical protein
VPNLTSVISRFNRDLIEYLLLISFVTIGSSYVFATEIEAAQKTWKAPSIAQEHAVEKSRHLNTIFSRATKRHIK